MREWHLSDDWLWRGDLTLLCRDEHDGRKWMANFAITFEPWEPGTVVLRSDSSGLQLTRDDAQQLLNELWRVGMRPRDGAGSLAHVDAQRAHLEDMRRLVFKSEEDKP
jgi:hypothetical protein